MTGADDMQWTVLEDAEHVAQRACDRISSAASEAIAARGCFTIVLAADTLAASRTLLFIVTGAAKRAALEAWRAGDTTLPVAAIRPGGRGEVLLDRDAAPGECLSPQGPHEHEPS